MRLLTVPRLLFATLRAADDGHGLVEGAPAGDDGLGVALVEHKVGEHGAGGGAGAVGELWNVSWRIESGEGRKGRGRRTYDSDIFGIESLSLRDIGII